MRYGCESVFKDKEIEIIRCVDRTGMEHFFAVSNGKRVKIGPIEGEHTSSVCSSCSK